MNLVISDIQKAFGLPESVDPDHEYVYRSGEFGIYDFWYKDRSENYWKYTNAPQDHPDYDPYGGDAMIISDQPMPHTAPQFYAEDGKKLHMAVPQGMEITLNEAYDPENPHSVWYGMYQSEDGEPRFVYYDSDVRENLDLWVQYMLRVTDAGLVPLRKYASKLFESSHPKDKVFGVMLMLVDQGFFEANELTQAKVEDVEYIDNTVKLLGRKLVCDPVLIDFFTSLTSSQEPSDPLFALDTVHGRNPVGVRHFYSVFKGLKISAALLLYWHASHLFSRIMHRLAAELVPEEEAEERAYAELGRTLNTAEDVTHLVDVKVKETLLRNYAPIDEQEALPEEGMEPGAAPPAPEDPEQAAAAVPPEEGEQAPAEPAEEPAEGEPVAKSIMRMPSDDFGVATVWSDLAVRRPDEQEFSMWLHATPLHDTTEAEQVAIEDQLAQQKEETAAEEGQTPADIDDEGAVNTPGDPTGPGTSPAPDDGAGGAL